MESLPLVGVPSQLSMEQGALCVYGFMIIISHCYSQLDCAYVYMYCFQADWMTRCALRMVLSVSPSALHGVYCNGSMVAMGIARPLWTLQEL